MKVISFSVWGQEKDYLVGAEKNAVLARQIYPGWQTWFYVEKGTDVSLEDKADRVIYYEPEPGTDGAFQRFRPMLDPGVFVFLSRDIDSRLSEREFEAVSAWLNSDKQFHAMRDHQAHVWPVMAGMWGAKRHGLINLEFLYQNLVKFTQSTYFDDQKALAQMYSSLSNLFLEHDDARRFNGVEFPEHEPITFGSFVGQRITWEDKVGRE